MRSAMRMHAGLLAKSGIRRPRRVRNPCVHDIGSSGQLALSRTGWSSPFVMITFALGEVASALRASMYS